MELDSIWVQATCCMQLEKHYQLLVNNWAKPTVGKNHAIEGSETAWHPLAKVSFDLHLIKGRQTFNRPFNSLLSLFDWIWKVGRIYFLWTCLKNRAKIYKTSYWYSWCWGTIQMCTCHMYMDNVRCTMYMSLANSKGSGGGMVVLSYTTAAWKLSSLTGTKSFVCSWTFCETLWKVPLKLNGDVWRGAQFTHSKQVVIRP